VRLHRSFILLRALLLVFAAGAAYGQTVVTLGASAGNTNGCALTASATCTLTARVTGLADTTVAFLFSPTPQSTGSSLGNQGAPDSTGLTTLTYKAPVTISARVTVTVTARASDGTVSNSVSITLVPPTVVVQVTPATATLSGGQTVRFTATVNASQSGVTWSISPQAGTIDASGLYTAPSSISATQKVTVTATSILDATASGTATITLNPPAISVGGGAPTDAIAGAFQAAWNRNGFNTLTVLPPLGNVKSFGSAGYVQEFTDAANSSLKDALITGATSMGGTNAVFQILAPLYAYYTTINANTAGYPLGDSQNCSAQGTACVWDTFDKSYALFAYASAIANGQNFNINGTFYTEWTAVGGLAALGAPVSAPTVTTGSIIAPATAGTTASVQQFAKGGIYSITSGGNRGKIFSITEPIYDLYVSQSGPSGTLGMPASEAFQLSATVFKQNFEGGALQYTVGSDPTIVLPVTSLALSGAQAGSTITLNVGQTLTVSATPIITGGIAVSDRPVSWSTTNGQVVSIQANGGTAVITAIGSGAASVQAASQGVSSGKIVFIVISPCCQIGDGAPLSVQQAFRDALTRNKLSVQQPLPAPAGRVGSGYVQMAPAADSSAVYMLAQSDRLGTAYVVSGALLTRYQALGGPAGTMGYPASDAGAGGTQLFAGGALGGSPVRLVISPVLAKWALLGYESGAAGLPVAEATGFETLGANAGQQQSFSKGVILGASSGPRAGQSYFTSGLILARYNALGGVAGDFGMPTSDEFISGALHQQNFEGGTITYSAGDVAAVSHAATRVPTVVASPGSVSAGARARLAVIGFANNSTVRVSVSGSPDFVVTTANGAYGWDMAIPLTAKSGSVTIHATDGKGASADGTLAIKGFADNRIQIAKVQGDNQSGLPGAILPLSLRVALLDASNTPVARAPVTFEASLGAQLSATSAITDATGQAEVFVRLPATAGIAAITVNAPSISQLPVTFYVRAAASSLSNVPALAQAGDAALGNGAATIGQKGALLTAVAGILRYHQNRGELAGPNGAADPATLNQFLKQYCSVDAKGAQRCDGFLSAGSGAEQIVNLWRAGEFTGGVDIAVQSPSVAAIADVLAQGSPALLSLALSRNGVPAGGTFVAATGVADDGSILIQDANPFFGRGSLTDYLHGFNSAGITWTGELRGVVQFALRSPSATRFLVGALSQTPELMKTLAIDMESPVGACGVPLELGDAIDSAGNASDGLRSRLQVCDGAQAVYEVSVGAGQPFHAFLTDLATAGSTVDLSGSGPVTYEVTRSRLSLVLAPAAAAFTPDAVVNGATFTPGIAPGGVVTIFGSGLAGAGSATSVDIDGAALAVLASSAFQINAVVPAAVAPGQHTLRVRSPFGTAQQTVTVSSVAPAIFLIGNPPVGAVANPDNSMNGAASPLARGQYLTIYGTGLGAVVRQGNLSAAVTPVTVVLNGQELPVLFAGLAPGFTGLYQVDVVVPATTPPGLGVSLTLKQGGQLSNTVIVAIQ
jgi:uncharacterized protein (TIGR03437 family)